MSALRGFAAVLALAWLALAPSAHAQSSPTNILELISREYSIQVGGAQTPESKELISRELTLFMGGQPALPWREAVSRAVSIVVPTPTPPAPAPQLVVVPVPARQTATLNWTGYNEWLQRDVARYDIYMFTRGGPGASRMERVASVPGETFSITLNNLPAGEDHFFAVVAVDALEAFIPPGSVAPGKYAQGVFSVTVNNPVGVEFVLLESPDLENWVPVSTNSPAAMPYAIGVTNVPGLTRFYRLLIQ